MIKSHGAIGIKLLYVSHSPVGWIRTNISVFGALNETITAAEIPNRILFFKLSR